MPADSTDGSGRGPAFGQRPRRQSGDFAKSKRREPGWAARKDDSEGRVGRWSVHRDAGSGDRKSMRSTRSLIVGSVLKAFGGRTARGAVGTLVLKVGSSGFALLTSLVLARSLGATGLGTFSYAIAWANILVIPAVFGLDVLLVREVAALSTTAGWAEMRALVGWTARVVGSLSVVIVVVATGIVLVSTRDDPQLGYALMIAVASIPFRSFADMFQGALRGLRHVIAAQLPNTVVRPGLLAVLAVMASLLAGSRFSAMWALWLYLLAALAAFGIGGLQMWRANPGVMETEKSPVASERWLKSALPFLLVSGMFVINNRADMIMLGVIRGQTPVGLYVTAVRGASLVAFVLAAANAALAPKLSELFASGDGPALKQTLRWSTATVFVLSVPIAIALIAFGVPFLGLFGTEFTKAYDGLVVLTLGQMANVAAGPVGLLLNMTGHERDTARAVVVSAVLNLGLNAVLIPRFGLVGAATATALSTVVWNIWMARAAYLRFGYYSFLGAVTVHRNR